MPPAEGAERVSAASSLAGARTSSRWATRAENCSVSPSGLSPLLVLMSVTAFHAFGTVQADPHRTGGVFNRVRK